MRKERLLTPGPSHIPDRILRAMERAAVHHRTSSFKAEFRQAIDGLRWLLGSPNDPILLAASGTGAMEAVLANLCAPGDGVVSVNAGAFGARWGEIAKKLELTSREMVVPWGESPAPDAVADFLSKIPEPVLFCIQQCETSTTVRHPVERLCALVKERCPNVFTVVDGISSVGTAPLTLESGAIDVIVTGSQKGLMLPAGLSSVALSNRAWARVETQTVRSLYWDLLRERKAHRENTSAWTPATHLVLGLNAALEMLREEGLDETFARHERLSRIARAGLLALGIEPLATENPSPGVTGFLSPAGIDAELLRKGVRERFGVSLAGGQGSWTGKVIRIGHMGYCDDLDVIGAISALEIVMGSLGGKSEPGAGAAAAVAAAAAIA